MVLVVTAASDDAGTPPPITVDVLAEVKALPAELLRTLGVKDWPNGAKISYGSGVRKRIRQGVSGKDSTWGSGSEPIVAYQPVGMRELAVEYDYAVIVEGESDVWTLAHHTYPAIGIPGATMAKTLGVRHVQGLSKLFVVREPGSAGSEFPRRIANRVRDLADATGSVGSGELFPAVFEIVMPDGTGDPSGLHLAMREDLSAFKAAFEKVILDASMVEPSDVSADSADSALRWDTPIPFDDFDLPMFPTDTLPEWLRNFVIAEARATQTPPDLTAMLGLSVIAAGVARRFEIDLGNWREPLNIYTVTVLASGNRKSAVFRAVTAPLIAEEERLQLEGRNAIAVALEEQRILKAKLNDARKHATDDGADKGDLHSLANAFAGFEIPAVPRLFADDVTSEKLEMLVAEQGGQMAIFSAEADVFDVMAGRYSSSGVTNLGVFLKGHPGDPIRVDRVGRESVIVQHPALTMGLAVQPDVIDSLASRREFRGRGLTPRLLYSLPRTWVGTRDNDPPAVDAQTRNAYEAHMTKLLSRQPDPGDDSATDANDYKPYILRLDTHAASALLDFANKIEPQLVPSGDLGDTIEWGSKLVGAVARIAGLLHLADLTNEAEPWKQEVSKDVIERAIEIGEYLIPHARAAFSLMGADPVVADARYLIAWFRDKQVESMSARDLFTETKGRFKKMDIIKPALELLELYGYLRIEDTERSAGPGRNPSPTLRINPAVLTQKPHNPHNRSAANG